MRLKYQLLFLSFLSFLLPITGWYALKTVDIEFRKSIELAAKNTLTSLQASVQQLLKHNKEYQLKGVVQGSLLEISVDGDGSEWSAIKAYNYQNHKQQLSVKVANTNHNLSLFIHSNDKSVAVNNLQLNDHIIIGLANNQGLYKYTIKRQAAGMVFDKPLSEDKPRYKAYWHEVANGYNLEIQFYQNDFHHVGVVSIDESLKNKLIVGTLASNDLKLLPIINNNIEFQSAISSITPKNNHFIIVDKQNRIIYQSDKLTILQPDSSWQWLITPIYQWLFGIDDNISSFYQTDEGMVGLLQTMTVDEITYNLKSIMPKGQQNMIQTLLKASILMIAVVLLIMMAYLLYALILAWRIRNLNKAMQTVLDDTGKVRTQMPSHDSLDEVGQLSRGIESMLVELQEYTHYLKDLGSRLSHEMKTPIAIVQTSLDNIEPNKDAEFLQRAKDGTNRLKFILSQLSELSQLKNILESTPKQRFNLTELCLQLGKSYQSYMNNLQTDITKSQIFVFGSAELMAQLIDKLMDNARDFTPKDGNVKIVLIKNQKHTILKVINSGSQLPKNKQLNIFESLVSQRHASFGKEAHLGLGLYMVQLITRYHNASIYAANTSNPTGVEFVFTIVNK